MARPWNFPKAGESLKAAYIREISAVGKSVGLTDISTLGKIDVQGPDVAEFLNRVYVDGACVMDMSGKFRRACSGSVSLANRHTKSTLRLVTESNCGRP